MPHANIWIRKENQDKWERITDKSDWVNSRLSAVFIQEGAVLDSECSRHHVSKSVCGCE